MVVICTEMCITKTHKNMDSHSYRDVHDENPYNKKWIFICTEMCIDENPYKKNINSHSYINVHDENLYTNKWIVIRTEMCMRKTHRTRNG